MTVFSGITAQLKRHRLDWGVVVGEERRLLHLRNRRQQIADHAAMRGLAPTRSLAELESPSILTLFSPASANPTPTAATRLDIAYLQALYRTAGEARGSTQRGILTRSEERSLQPRRGQGAN